MTRLWRNLWRSDSGASAIEFGLVLPILIGLLLFGVNAWQHLSRAQDMSSALQTGARYYQGGGADDETAKALAMAAWPNPSEDASLKVARSCACEATTVTCSTTCSGAGAPKTFITLSAQATFHGLSGASPLSQQETVRVR